MIYTSLEYVTSISLFPISLCGFFLDDKELNQAISFAILWDFGEWGIVGLRTRNACMACCRMSFHLQDTRLYGSVGHKDESGGIEQDQHFCASDSRLCGECSYGEAEEVKVHGLDPW